MQQEMDNRDEETLELKETYSSLQQEVDIKTKKLKKVRHVVPRPGVVVAAASQGFTSARLFFSSSLSCRR